MPGTEQPSRSDIGGAAITLMSLRDGDLVSWHLRSKLKALPIHDPKTFSLRSTISYLINISEPLPIGVVTIRTALNEIRGAAIEKYTKPDKFESVRETVAYMVNREVKSPKCTWKRHGHCLVLLARCELVERANIPGVALEFVTRTGKSAWAVHRDPPPGNWSIQNERNLLKSHFRKDSNHEEDTFHRAADCLCSTSAQCSDSSLRRFHPGEKQE